ncbi:MULTISPECIES: hypothetical protein [Streptomyces]|uniref:Uncharacterized protein n=1 Tax=Streptomyces spororaveus TaxID=284039 RepID=A0ABQ3T7T6_9ACTN|nr:MULTISPECIES: hypothetical protein [Streptomyces]MCM9083276.1 hypothetical protein [Streptomyces spororaveus]MCX5302124.1 hypothetical protein [Streptomyces sp. NBC_00160]GHI76456.1 hypothetical protein Sspor_20170 [Streptomyces spororaveus]
MPRPVALADAFVPGVVPAFLSGFTQTRAPGLSQTVVADLANAFVADLAETSVTDLVTRLAEAFVPAFVGDVAFAPGREPDLDPLLDLAVELALGLDLVLDLVLALGLFIVLVRCLFPGLFLVAEDGEESLFHPLPEQLVINGIVVIDKCGKFRNSMQKLLHYLAGQRRQFPAQDARPLATRAGPDAVQKFTHRFPRSCRGEACQGKSGKPAEVASNANMRV